MGHYQCLICCRPTALQHTRTPLGVVYTCSECGLVAHERVRIEINETAPGTESIITDPAFTKGEMERHRVRCDRAERLVSSRIQAYERLLGRKLSSVLEVGCGDGAWANPFLKRGIRYHALEIVPALVDFCRKNAVPVSESELQKWRAPERYDVVFASQVLEHVLTPVDFVGAAAECLNEGGLLHVDMPNHAGLISLVHRIPLNSRRFGALEKPHHLIGYTPSSLATLLSKAGFEPVMVTGLRNDDPEFGQLFSGTSWLQRATYFLTGVGGLGSLLTGIGRRANHK